MFYHFLASKKKEVVSCQHRQSSGTTISAGKSLTHPAILTVLHWFHSWLLPLSEEGCVLSPADWVEVNKDGKKEWKKKRTRRRR
jgi:hypothetical protein